MSLNIVNKSEAPIPPYEAHSSCINIQFIPHILYGLWLKSQKYYWASTDDWTIARSALAEQGACILLNCNLGVENRLESIYNLLDARLTGIEREYSGTGTEADPFVYSPPIEQAAVVVEGVEPGLVLNARRSLDGWHNLLNGETTSEFTDERNFRQQLADLIDQDVEDDADIASLLALVEASGISLTELLILLG